MEFHIDNCRVGNLHPLYFIAEAGVNHNGSIELAFDLIDAAALAGANAVKFQTFKAENLNTRNAPKSTYHIETTGKDSEQTWFDLLKTQEIDREMHLSLMRRCKKKKITFLSTPYDEESADLLEELGVKAFKLASTDTTNIPLIKHVARKGLPLILSTAMCDMEEVEEAVDAVRSEGLRDFAVLQCTGNYPAAIEDSNIRVMQTFREKFSCLVGFSDHNIDIINPIAATALGACIYEKHFTIDKGLPGPDHRMAMDPRELNETIIQIRKTEISLGSSQKFRLKSEHENSLKLRKSIVASRLIKPGETLDRSMVSMKRPGTGISPSRIDELLGRHIIKEILPDTLLEEEHFE